MCFMWCHAVNPLDWTKPRKLEETQRVTLQSPLNPLFSEDTRKAVKPTNSKRDPNVNSLKHKRPEVTHLLYPFQRILPALRAGIHLTLLRLSWDGQQLWTCLNWDNWPAFELKLWHFGTATEVMTWRQCPPNVLRGWWWRGSRCLLLVESPKCPWCCCHMATFEHLAWRCRGCRGLPGSDTRPPKPDQFLT